MARAAPPVVAVERVALLLASPAASAALREVRSTLGERARGRSPLLVRLAVGAPAGQPAVAPRPAPMETVVLLLACAARSGCRG
ncbi:MAG TPA: hypothetical protein VG266_07715 [Candidatus Dormibacteraeota bacterium]|nr:hypothetical protein [Candidatus Dormibacteraeota bacterium]